MTSTESMQAAPALELVGITKTFGALRANDAIDLHVARGEIVALLGENGAGKTTLMNILFGHYTADAGEVRVNGRALPPGAPRAAIRAGVGMVHQHFSLADNLTVLDSVMVGTERLSALRSGRRAARAKLAAIAGRFGLPVDPDARVGDLSVGERQRVEILKTLYNDAGILILDEPTAVLTATEAEGLFATLREMAAQGLSVIFISHKLHEVMAAADRVVVLRGGRVVAERRTGATSAGELAELMVGRAVRRPTRTPARPGAVVLRAEDVAARPARGRALSAVSFTLRAGEILGIVGVAGNGQKSLADLVSGLLAPASGRLELFGRAVGRLTVRAAIDAGIGRIPEDRLAEGVVADMALWENAVLERIRSPRFSRLGGVRRAAARAYAGELIETFDIRGATPATRTRLLSGGNMQKLILGRNLESAPRVLVAAQPTRGLDEGAVAGVHERLLAARDAGAAVLLISEDLDEVMALADRVQAIVDGRLSPDVPSGELDARGIGLLMAGHWRSEAEAVHAH